MESYDSFDTDDFSNGTTSFFSELDSDPNQDFFVERLFLQPLFLSLILNQEDALVQEEEIPEVPEKELESKLEEVIGVYHQLSNSTLWLWIRTQ